MLHFNHCLAPLAHYLTIYQWRDIVEIFFFSTSMYIFSNWLAKDQKNKLLLYFYGSVACAWLAHTCYFFTISYFFFIASPFAIIFCILFHQETLQKNFITAKNITPLPSLSWLEELMQSCLYGLNNNKEFVCVIECNDQINEQLIASCLFYADLKREIFDILLEKHIHTPHTLVWVNKTGKLVAINAAWRIAVDQQWMSAEAVQLPKWKQDALLITSKTDSVVMKINPHIRTFDIVAQGKMVDYVTAEQTFLVLQKHLEMSSKNKISRSSQISYFQHPN